MSRSRSYAPARRRSRVTLALASAAVALAAPTSTRAQNAGTVEVALFGQRTAFDEGTTLAFGTAPGLGGLVGFYLVDNLVVEAGWAYTWTEPAQPPRIRASHVPLRARVAYHLPVTETFYPIVGLGLVRNDYSRAVEGSDAGLSALVGFKTYVRDRVAFRSDVHLDLVGSPFNEGATVGSTTVSQHVNWNLTAGLSLDLGPGRFSDADRDQVRDRLDECPETPFGVGVDSRGCRLDEDRDRVFDEDDACPGTPLGVGVDRVGCRIDTDADGVFDEDDRCPSTPAGVRVDGAGCALDSDGDRVPDFRDACPGTAAGVPVDGVGCPLDTDRDGVIDATDRCPDTPFGDEVDVTGCTVLFEDTETTIVLEGVTFETASATLTPEARVVLVAVAQSLVANPDVRVRVNGHTDSTGSRDYNLVLSQARADAVARYLVERGVAADRLESRGFGPDEPVATNDTPDGRRQNRRVELERIDQG